MLIYFNDILNAVHFGIEDVAVKGKAVVGLLGIRRDGGTEAKHWDLLVAVVILQDATDSLDGFQVLILL